MKIFLLQHSPIEDKVYLVDDPQEGARVVFWGLVRMNNLGRDDIQKIEYSCYEELAISEGNKILDEALTKYEIQRVHCVHRIGSISLQERAIRIEIGSSHREPAFLACKYIMDEIKTRIPIWKKEFSASEGIWIDG